MSNRLDRSRALEILSNCGIPQGTDYHRLSSSQVDELLSEADNYGYRKPKNANGSRARYFHAFVERVASRESE